MEKEKEMNRNGHEKDIYRVTAGSQNFKEQSRK